MQLHFRNANTFSIGYIDRLLLSVLNFTLYRNAGANCLFCFYCKKKRLNQFIIHSIWGSQSGNYVQFSLVEYKAM
jgi:hypothetical protein